MGFVQSVDARALIDDPQGVLPAEVPIKSAEISRVFGGGGSEAKLTVIFDSFLTAEQQRVFEQGIDPEGTPGDEPDREAEIGANSVLELPPPAIRKTFDVDISEFSSAVGAPEDLSGDPPTVLPEERQKSDITVEVKISTTINTATTISRTVFTGTLTKVTENNEREVVLQALDRRFQLNRNSVFLEIGSEGATVTELIRTVLEEGYNGDGLGYTSGEEFVIDFGKDVSLLVNQSWGLERHVSVYEFLQDMMQAQGATMYIDNENTIIFTDFPEHTIWGSQRGRAANPGADVNTRDRQTARPTATGTVPVTGQLPPIIQWKNSEEESKSEVIAETSFDETGRGIFSAVTQERLQAIEEGTDPYVRVEDVNRKIKRNNVVSREAVERVQEFENISDDLLRNSGTVDLAGDPRFEPYDEVVLNTSELDGFAPISTGKYLAKEVTFIINSQDGFITRLELGDDPEELFEEIAEVSGSRAPPPDDSGGSWIDGIADAISAGLRIGSEPVIGPLS